MLTYMVQIGFEALSATSRGGALRTLTPASVPRFDATITAHVHTMRQDEVLTHGGTVSAHKRTRSAYTAWLVATDLPLRIISARRRGELGVDVRL